MDLKELGLQRVSFNEKQRLNSIIAKEGDSGTRGLLVEFEEGLDCMCYMEIDGVIHEIEGVEVEEGLYEVIYPSSLLKGIVPAEIKFYKGKEILSNYIFDICVKKSINIDKGYTIVEEGRFDEDIETTVEYYDEFVRVGYPWGRNLYAKNTGVHFRPNNSSFSPHEERFIEDGKLIRRLSVNEGAGRGIAYYSLFISDLINSFTEGKEYTLSCEVRPNVDLNVCINSRAGYTLVRGGEWTRVSYTTNTDTRFGMYSLEKATEIYPMFLDVRNLKIEEGSQATPWTPAPEDYNDLKGTQYNLSTPFKKDTYYTLSVKGDFQDDDFIGIWLGNDKFIGFLQDNKITFKSNIDIDDDYIIVKSLKEEGTINSISIKEV